MSSTISLAKRRQVNLHIRPKLSFKDNSITDGAKQDCNLDEGDAIIQPEEDSRSRISNISTADENLSSQLTLAGLDAGEILMMPDLNFVGDNPVSGQQYAFHQFSTAPVPNDTTPVENVTIESCGSTSIVVIPEQMLATREQSIYDRNFHTQTPSNTLAITYILFLAVIAIMCYQVDLHRTQSFTLAESFNLCLMTIQVLWLLLMIIAVRLYRKKLIVCRNEDHEVRTEMPESFDESVCSSAYNVSRNFPGANEKAQLPQGFLFCGEELSLYVKIGVTVLCTGYLLHIGLKLAAASLYLASNDPDIRSCTNNVNIAMYCLQCLSIFYQMFFAVKYSNLIINKWLVLSKFGIIHCIGTSLSFGVYTIIEEIISSITNDEGQAQTSEAESSQIVQKGFNFMSSGYIDCRNATAVSRLLQVLDPYIYPYCIQMNLLMVGFWIVLSQNVGKAREWYINSSPGTIEKHSKLAVMERAKVIYVDCHASNRGLFVGMLLIAGSITSIVISLSISNGNVEAWQKAMLVNGIWQVCLLLLMIFAATMTFYDMLFLDVIKRTVTLTYDVLLYSCLPFVFLHALLSLLPYVNQKAPLTIIVNILSVLQVILQTSVITHGRRLCSNSESNQNKKPGREFVMFLLVSNIAMWLTLMFQVHLDQDNEILNNFYGTNIWIIASHSTLPMTLFYRFHSSLQLADIWKAAYEPDEGDC